MEQQQHVLYKFYDSRGTLLYIGLTGWPRLRFKQHNKDKDWWTEIAEIKMRRLPSREMLEHCEACAIIDEKPLYNKLIPIDPRIAEDAEMDRQVDMTYAAILLKSRDNAEFVELASALGMELDPKYIEPQHYTMQIDHNVRDTINYEIAQYRRRKALA